MPADLELLIAESLASVGFPFSHTTPSGSAKTYRWQKQAETLAVIDFAFSAIAQSGSIKTVRQNDVNNRPLVTS
ncbi:hypothetical protein [Microcoleus sp. CAWBG58]|uniref:hypothetical protein n=1 Tax=Microcoleus sp. CAWBG58 TaxID=2841651 RepID=UPI0025E1F641|nr:hypothetical protein [Microcoleus sp. CAWBG58]